jgi:hypothetical protein
MTFIYNENTWSFHFKNNTQNGNKYYFRCNKARRREKQCPAGIYLLSNSQNEDVVLFRTEDDNLQKNNRLDDEAKTEIDKLFALNIKPKTILTKLREN